MKTSTKKTTNVVDNQYLHEQVRETFILVVSWGNKQITESRLRQLQNSRERERDCLKATHLREQGNLYPAPRLIPLQQATQTCPHTLPHVKPWCRMHTKHSVYIHLNIWVCLFPISIFNVWTCSTLCVCIQYSMLNPCSYASLCTFHVCMSFCVNTSRLSLCTCLFICMCVYRLHLSLFERETWIYS